MRKLVTIILSLLCGACLIGALVACGDGKVDYTIEVKSAGGANLQGVQVNLFDDELNLVESDTTDNTGTVTLRLDPKVYTVRLVENTLPKGYEMPTEVKSTKAEAGTVTYYLESHVINEPIPANKVYSPGDVMYDFTVTTTTGDTWTLSEVLKEKKMVLLNFFYIGCTYCDKEFPYLVNGYNSVKDASKNILYSDEVAVLALDIYAGQPTDTDQAIEDYKMTSGWSNTFDWAQDTAKVWSHFVSAGTPTNIVIDRFGMFCQLDEGAQLATTWFTKVFSKYTSDNYIQDNHNPLNPDTPPRPKPTAGLTQPDTSVISAAINGTNVTGEKFVGTYHPSTEADTKDWDYSWPWLVGEEADGTKYIYNSNKGVQSYSFATIHLNFHAKKGDVIAFDYFADIESGYDSLTIVYNKGQVVSSLSSMTDGWQTSYFTYIDKEGDYEIYFLYNTDEMNEENSVVDDIVKIKNIRITNEAEMIAQNASLEIRYECATDFDYDQNKWTNYVEVGYNKEDGYYHLKAEGDAADEYTGPLVLMNAANESHWSNKSIYEYAIAGQFNFKDEEGNGPDYTTLINNYCTYATNSLYNLYVPVTKELHDALVDITRLFVEGEDSHETYANEWLEMCVYVVHFGVGEAVKDPIKGVAPFTATEVYVTGDKTDPADLNFIDIDKVIMPRGMFYSFTPDTDGVYEFKAYGTERNLIWIYNADEYDAKGVYADVLHDEGWGGLNFTVYVPMKAGVKYYVTLDMYDQTTGSYHLGIKNLGDRYVEFHSAAGGYTTSEDFDSNGNTISGTFHIIIGLAADSFATDEDGNPALYYKGNESPVYVDLLRSSGVLIGYDGLEKDRSLADVFLSTEDENGFMVAVRDENGNRVDRDHDGIDDFEYIKYEGETLEYLKGLIEESKTHEGELYGMVQVDAKLMEILDELTHKVAIFRNGLDKYGNIQYVENEWLLMCYYYRVYTV